jgi:iron complex transport system ATP-binding protein
VIDWALEVTGTIDFKFRPVDALSGGQRQRVWIAMALAQETEIIFLDEPTTYLDMAHQLEVLELLQKLNYEQERTIVMVLHDLNQAARFADHIIALKDGEIVKAGNCEEVISHKVLKKVFNIDAVIGHDPRTGKPMCITYNLLKGETNHEKTTTALYPARSVNY